MLDTSAAPLDLTLMLKAMHEALYALRGNLSLDAAQARALLARGIAGLPLQDAKEPKAGGSRTMVENIP